MDETPDLFELVETIRHLLDQLDDERVTQTVPPHDRIELYAAAYQLAGEAAVVVAGLRKDAITAMHDLDVPRNTLVDTAQGGAVWASKNVATYRWHGWELCDALAADRVDIDSGEIVRAVDVDRLRAVLPACGSDAHTSSKWNARALERLVEIDRYREGEPVWQDTIDIIPKMARED